MASARDHCVAQLRIAQRRPSRRRAARRRSRAAKFGPVSTAAGRSGADVSARISSGNAQVPASTPFAQQTTAPVAGNTHGDRAQMLHRHGHAASGRRRRGVSHDAHLRGRCARPPGADSSRLPRSPSRARGRAPIAQPPRPRAPPGSPARCPRRRRRRPATLLIDQPFHRRPSPGSRSPSRSSNASRIGGDFLFEPIGRVDHEQAAAVQPRRVERLAQPQLGGDHVADAAVAHGGVERRAPARGA